MKKTLVKKHKKDELVTKKYLDEKLEVNRKYLDEKIDLTRKELKGTENYLNYKIDTLEKKVDNFKEEFTGFKDSVLKSLDWLVGAFTKFNEEHTVLTEQNKRTNVKLDNHEERISSIEQRVVT